MTNEDGENPTLITKK